MGLEVKFADGRETYVTIIPSLYAETLTALLKAGAVQVDYIGL